MGGTVMKRLQLTTWERVTLLGCIPRACPLVDLPQYLRVIKILMLTEEEEDLVGYIKVRTPDGRESTTWTKTKLLFDVEFNKKDFRCLMELVDARKLWPTLDETTVLIERLEDAKAQPAEVEENA